MSDQLGLPSAIKFNEMYLIHPFGQNVKFQSISIYSFCFPKEQRILEIMYLELLTLIFWKKEFIWGGEAMTQPSGILDPLEGDLFSWLRICQDGQGFKVFDTWYCVRLTSASLCRVLVAIGVVLFLSYSDQVLLFGHSSFPKCPIPSFSKPSYFTHTHTHTLFP